ncbi:putative dehydrogenase [Kineosphaera limosa]|uniref:Putative oxidoreductase n=1 Tax=Kineosphaera limosa NBRC 100340 TaxID=1184609 RepID=K6VJK6_9MICO|nr:Gfo/Idh/MocA family oxidoreductase [Kineosphaera limosa]NYE00786.1 putative dehydrogenase [Kineosphaera limosa]GAB96398.1 putative oxidoreductase [Kineosphaera limosa NBRC 100340]
MALPDALPAPRVPDPMTAPSLRWGILGTGWIADKFTQALQAHTRQKVVAVGSRSQSGADRFAQRFDLPAAVGSYDDLVQRDDVDVIYVATPHNHHHEDALRAIGAGKHVLVEKPIALNAAQARDIAAAAARADVMAMEALWTMFLPKFDIVRQLLANGVLGRIHTVFADHGQHFEGDHRILRRDLAGGPTLDLLTYPVAFANWVLGAPREVLARTTWTPNGEVTGQTSVLLMQDDGAQAMLHSSVLSRTPTAAAICGEDAMIAFDPDFYVPAGFTVSDNAGASLRHDEPEVAHTGGLHYQAAQLAWCIAAGERSCTIRPLEESIQTMVILDEARRQIGEIYPEEQ